MNDMQSTVFFKGTVKEDKYPVEYIFALFYVFCMANLSGRFWVTKRILYIIEPDMGS